MDKTLPRILEIFILSLLLIITSESFSQLKEKIQDKHSLGCNSESEETKSKVNKVDVAAASLYYQKSLVRENTVFENDLPADPFANLVSCRVQGASGTNDGRFTPFRGIVIGYNYVCVTKGSWQWESGKLKYFFTSRLTCSIKAKIKYFKFDNVEINLNFKL